MNNFAIGKIENIYITNIWYILLYYKNMFKPPKGTVDLYGKEADCVEHIIKVIEDSFKQFNGKRLITPTFELRDILLKKKLDGQTYASDEIETKLIYDLHP